MLKLVFTNCERNPAWVVDKVFLIGNAENCQLRLKDPILGAQHARLALTNRQYVLRDLGNPLGTFVNDQRINERTLHHGDRVRLGSIELLVQDPARAEVHQHWVLVACSSWLAGQEFALKPRHSEPQQGCQIKIGRASHCDVIFPGTHLSREHARLTLAAHGLEVEDLDSANGTFINDQRITRGELHSGDTLRLDVYSFAVFGPEVNPPPSPEKDTSDPTGEHARPKQWRVRPTSPGNRQESANPKPTGSLAWIALSGLLALAVLGLGAYLLFG